MATEINKRYENKPLAEYRLKVRSTKWFLKRFYTPVWLQRPTKTNLIVSLVSWAIGIVIVLYYRTSSHTDERGTFLFDLMVATTTLTMAGLCISYFKRNNKGKDVDAPNT